MTGIRLGERLLYAGSGTPALFGALAAKVGLTGRAAAVGYDKAEVETLNAAGTNAGVLVEVTRMSPGAFPFEAESFDLVVVDATSGRIDEIDKWLGDAGRVLRLGGRLIVAERTVRGGLLGGLLKSGGSRKADAALRIVEARGLRPARIIADRDGWRFTEGLKR